MATGEETDLDMSRVCLTEYRQQTTANSAAWMHLLAEQQGSQQSVHKNVEDQVKEVIQVGKWFNAYMRQNFPVVCQRSMEYS